MAVSHDNPYGMASKGILFPSPIYSMRSHSPPLGVGIDVSKETLHVGIRYTNTEEHFVVANTLSGIETIAEKLEGYTGNIVMESTGRYHILAALLLSQKKFTVRVVNPLDAKRYTSGKTRKKKTDESDACLLAHMAFIEKRLPAPFVAEKLNVQIRHKIGLVCALEKKMQSLVAMIKDYEEFQKQIGIEQSDSEKDLHDTILQIEKQKKLLESEVEKLMRQHDQHKKFRTAAESIPGVSAFLSCLLSETLDTGCVSAKQWIHFVGLDIPPRESGRWRGKSRLSKRGNPYLRKRLFNAAWGAKQNDEHFQMYYKRLRDEGRSYKEAMLIICRKILRILFALLKKDELFSHQDCLFA